jgi:peptidoglycan/xylan/chitin deacetylase (PgdA/CDA1 family)
MDHFCKNHPEKKTRKRCNYCKDYVCPECLREYLGAAFCSLSCLRRAMLRDAGEALRLRSVKGKKSQTRVFKPFPWLPHLLYILLFLLIWQQFRTMHRELASLNAAINALTMVRVDTVHVRTEAPPESLPPATAPTSQVPLPQPRPRTVDFSRGNLNSGRMALTFDGGSGDGAAAGILDDLKAKNVRCTFFLTGRFINKFPDVVRRMVAEGHEVGNHTWSHPHLTTFVQNRRQQTLPQIDRRSFKQELLKTANLFQQVTGKEMIKLWRAPYGEQNEEIRRWAAELGYTHVGWTVRKGQTLDTFDWVADPEDQLYQTSQTILRRILRFGENEEHGANGGIILMHLDTQRQEDPAAAIVPTLIDSIRTRGYYLVTVSQMLDGTDSGGD